MDSEIGGLGSKSEFEGEIDKRKAALSIPLIGRSWPEIQQDLISRKNRDFDWRRGRVPIYVYHDSDELLRVSCEAYNLYFSENALGKRAFPSLAGMEDEVLRMCLSLFKGPSGATGSFTSGGTESIFLAIKAARDRHRATRPFDATPNIVIPITAHPAFDKAAGYLDVKVIRVGIGSDFKCDADLMREAVNEQTILIAGSAPCYPFGVFDPIESLSEIAICENVCFHVDACLGGFLAPFARDAGWPIPEFDLSVPGVTSLSADLHKFGFSARGSSVVLYRDLSYHAYQGFFFDNWPRGSYSTETFLGSRTGGSIASAWAVLQYLGVAGYRRLASKTMEAKHKLVGGIEKIAGLKVIYPSELNIVVYNSTSDSVDINGVADVLGELGWFVGRCSEPEGIHLAINAVHVPAIDDYLDDLQQAVEHVRLSGKRGDHVKSTY